jgi:hypothetical protein
MTALGGRRAVARRLNKKIVRNESVSQLVLELQLKAIRWVTAN